MCGVFGYIGEKQNAASIVLAGLKSLEYRGYDSWGVALVPILSDKKTNGQKVLLNKKVGKIGQVSELSLPNGSLALGHTRWATHGGVTKKNAHPHLDCSGRIAVVHNGIFENYEVAKM